MLVSKSFLVTGSTLVRDGKQHKDIGIKIDEVINDFLSKFEGGRLVDIKPNVTINPGVAADHAFIMVIVDMPAPEPKWSAPSESGPSVEKKFKK